uniref:Uncharacterized protein n=1 Tax=Arundo donax TaxID=35708 RepID=A0A0A9EYT5_ARUDO
MSDILLSPDLLFARTKVFSSWI